MIEKSPYEVAVARKRELEEELRKIETFLEMYKEFSGVPFLSNEKTKTEQVSGIASVSQKPHLPPAGMTQEEFESVARKLLMERGRPATRKQFLRMMKAAGHHIGGQNELKNLGTKLWRARGTITNLAPHGYWLKSEPCPSIGYVPLDEASNANRNSEQ